MIKISYFVLVVMTGVLCVPVAAQVAEPSLQNELVLLGSDNPALTDISQLYVVIAPDESEPNRNALLWGKIDEQVQNRLSKSGIGVIAGSAFPKPCLEVCINMLKLDDLQQYVFCIQTSLARTVTLPPRPKLPLQDSLWAGMQKLRANVWRSEQKMQSASLEDMADKITAVVMEQTEAFIHSYTVANQQSVKPAVESVAAEYKYVASKNSKVFHKSDCSSAERIAPANLTGYAGRADAIKAGKRPCKRCKP